MATVNFSVPEEVKQAFNETFKDRKKSAVIAELMREAVDRARRRERQSEAIARILALRAQTEPVSPEAIRAAREEGRP
jgi:metal-responsive CopG/Arc/MetJ family transcriptional regulator